MKGQPQYRQDGDPNETPEAFYARRSAWQSAWQYEKNERVNNLAANENQREAFDLARQAVLPDSSGTVGGQTSLLGVRGDLKPHRFDRFAKYESLGAFLRSCDKQVTPTKTEQEWITQYEGQHADTMVAHLKLRKGPQNDPAWEGMETAVPFEGVREFLLGGWPEGATRIREAMSAVTPPAAMDMRRRGAWSDQGEDLSTDRLYAGNFESAWRTTKKRFTHAAQRIRIAVDLGSACSACGTVGHNAEYLDARSLFWRGAAAASLAENLEGAGYRVEVVACCGICATSLSGGNGDLPAGVTADRLSRRYATGPDVNSTGIAIIVKDFSAPVDVSQIAAGTGSAVTYRRAMFLSTTVNRHEGEEVSDMFGAMQSVEHSPRLRRELGLDTEGVATLFVSHWVLTQKLANAWARGALYGIESLRTGLTATDLPNMEEEG